MDKIEKQFVSYEIAIKLKGLGFDEKCLAWYCNKLLLPIGQRVDKYNNDIMGYNNTHINKPINGHGIAAPLYQQVIDWFREEHHIYMAVLPYRNTDDGIELCWFYTLVQDSEELEGIYLNAEDLNASKENFDSNYKAHAAAVSAAINLIHPS